MGASMTRQVERARTTRRGRSRFTSLWLACVLMSFAAQATAGPFFTDGEGSGNNEHHGHNHDDEDNTFGFVDGVEAGCPSEPACDPLPQTSFLENDFFRTIFTDSDFTSAIFDGANFSFAEITEDISGYYGDTCVFQKILRDFPGRFFRRPDTGENIKSAPGLIN